MVRSACSLAALCRKAVKRGDSEINPKEAASTDPSFVIELEHSHTVSGLSTSETPSGINTSQQCSVFTVTPTYSHDISSSSLVSLTTEKPLASSKQPQLFINPTHGPCDGVEGDSELSLGHKVSSHLISLML